MFILKRYRLYAIIISLVVAFAGYFIFNSYRSTEELATEELLTRCPRTGEEITKILDYLSVIEYEEAMNILNDLSNRNCDNAVEKIVTEITGETEPVTSPGSGF